LSSEIKKELDGKPLSQLSQDGQLQQYALGHRSLEAKIQGLNSNNDQGQT
jgi:hypothetical protein